jgi:hypothetical protein
MDTFREDALYLALDKFADVDAIACADLDEGFVPLWVQFRADVFAIEAHSVNASREYVVSRKRRHPDIITAAADELKRLRRDTDQNAARAAAHR